MIKLPINKDLIKVARRVVWFKKPEDALKHPYHFMAHLLTYGTLEDISCVKQYVNDKEIAEAIENAPPGVFDIRSWTYWNLIIGKSPAPPLPKRLFG